ncbi:MAG: hypothetical protein A2X12_05225 [Bacteroidetes bacterium GWE2_29_8]|nr:MAG: hypothetical protein A2X12_05225 [Bacteroidetes bacterium GWE2_29_8]OFY15561.1 MAG: hypothetical protein A2X02_04220 [Bacteroidetes bacterium GWF2_29_10]
MKKINLLIFVFVIISFQTFSQNRFGAKLHEKSEYIESKKIAFITKELELTSTEAQVFWPIYNEFENKKQLIHQDNKCKKICNSIGSIDALTDKEAEQIADNDIIVSQKMLELRKEYHQKYKSAIPIKKVAKLYIAEKKFRQILLKDYKIQNCNRGNLNNE